MPRLLGVDIPNNRPAIVSLTYLYGVGPKMRESCATRRASIRRFAPGSSARTSWLGWRHCWTRITWSRASCAGSGARTLPG